MEEPNFPEIEAIQFSKDVNKNTYLKSILLSTLKEEFYKGRIFLSSTQSIELIEENNN
jgi:hypothetical protein